MSPLNVSISLFWFETCNSSCSCAYFIWLAFISPSDSSLPSLLLALHFHLFQFVAQLQSLFCLHFVWISFSLCSLSSHSVSQLSCCCCCCHFWIVWHFRLNSLFLSLDFPSRTIFVPLSKSHYPLCKTSVQNILFGFRCPTIKMCDLDSVCLHFHLPYEERFVHR